MTALIIVIIILSSIFILFLHKLVDIIDKQNQITENHYELAKDIFIEAKGNRLNNEKTRILNEEYLEIILLEKKLQFNPKQEVVKRPRKQIKPKNNA